MIGAFGKVPLWLTLLIAFSASFMIDILAGGIPHVS